MAIEWSGNKGIRPGAEFEVRVGEVFAMDTDGRKIEPKMVSNAKVGKKVTKHRLFWRGSNARRGWGHWGLVGNFDSDAEAKAYAEKF